MNYSIERSILLDALQKIQTVVEKKNTVQILGNILCVAKGQQLSLCGTDLEVGIKVTIPANVSIEGKATFSAKQFLDIVKELPEKTLFISSKENHWIELICEKSKFNMISLSPDQYPPLPSFEEKKYFEANTELLIEMIDRTEFAASTDTTRYQINGVYFELLESGIIRIVGTDGHRLSFVDNELFLNQPDFKRGIIIPQKGLIELRKILNHVSHVSVGLAFERGYLFVRLENSYLFIRLIEGDYPDYKPVIPTQSGKMVLLNRELFQSALKRVSLLANEKSKAVKLLIQENLLLIASSHSDLGEAREEIDILYKGDPIEIGFNSKYLLECLSVMKSNQIEFYLKDRLSPGVVKEENSKNHTYVIMPMRI